MKAKLAKKVLKNPDRYTSEQLQKAYERSFKNAPEWMKRILRMVK